MMRAQVFQAVVHRQVKNFFNRLLTVVSAAALRPITNQNEGSSAESTTKEPELASGRLYQGQASASRPNTSTDKASLVDSAADLTKQVPRDGHRDRLGEFSFSARPGRLTG
jgi:hypothetical protein